MNVSRNLRRIDQQLSVAAEEAGRKREDIQLVAVTKTLSPDVVRETIAAGQMVFGENTMQDALTKVNCTDNQQVEWHFIGHLQSNKSKSLVANFQWLHTLDSLKLASKISSACQTIQITTAECSNINALVQVNIAGDINKSGVTPGQLFVLMEELVSNKLPFISLRGLMTVAVQGASDYELRKCFAQLRHLRDECIKRFSLSDFTELSMGMSQDYQQAIKEGATLVRIGSEIFGSRIEKKNI